LTDFGLARTLRATGLTTPALLSGTLRYQAPELLPCMDGEDESNPRVTKETDVWSFSMTIVEVRLSRSRVFSKLIMDRWQVLTGSKPFSHIVSDMKVFLQVVNGRRPERNRCKQINDDVWNMLQRCWNREPSQRPSMATLMQFFSEQSISAGKRIEGTRTAV
jgi:serine/threonine protein kinase